MSFGKEVPDAEVEKAPPGKSLRELLQELEQKATPAPTEPEVTTAPAPEGDKKKGDDK